jgi:hypothetical protein
MKPLTTLLNMLWQSMILLPVAFVTSVSIITYAVFGIVLFSWALFDSDWYWLVLGCWGASIYLLRKPLRAYFDDGSGSGL